MGTFNETEIAKTRKVHWCYGCGHVFPAGSSSLSFNGVHDGGAWRVYFCPDCVEFISRVGREKFMQWYNEACECELSEMCLQEKELHPRYESEEDYNERRKKERLEKSKIAGI